MLASVNTSAKGSPSLPAKRARNVSKFVIDVPERRRPWVGGAPVGPATRRHSLFFAGVGAEGIA
jgi:hypothetical protein